jgi:hypothetical protein
MVAFYTIHAHYIQSDFFSCVSTCQNIGATDGENQVIGSWNAYYMGPTAIRFESPGIIPLFFLLVFVRYLE